LWLVCDGEDENDDPVCRGYDVGRDNDGHRFLFDSYPIT